MNKQCPVCNTTYPDATTFCPSDGTQLSANKSGDQTNSNEDKFIGKVLEGKYLVRGLLGSGGMGNVYRGRHTQMESDVAIKILHSSLVSDAKAVERFRREARAALAVNHPNAIQVMDFGVTDDQTVFIVMELLDGISMQKIIEKEKILPVDRVVFIYKQICAAVAAAHNKNVIHRDLKPDNVIILNYNTPSELVKVLDFSIAKITSPDSKGPDAKGLTEVGLVVGTPQYMSPEQAQGLELDKRADIYSLGVTLYQMLTGILPFTAASSMALALKHIHALPRPLREVNAQIPSSIESVVMKAMAKKPADRQQSAEELAEELDNALKLMTGKQQQASTTASSSSGSKTGALEMKPISGTSTPVPKNTKTSTASQPAANAENREQKSKTGLYIAIAVIVILLISGGIGAYLKFGTGGSKQNTGNDKFFANMVWLKGDTFKMGRAPETATKDELDQTPVHPTAVADFWMGRYEVTNEEYKQFLDDTKRKAPEDWPNGNYAPDRASHPITNINWTDAVAYCDWLSTKSGRKFRLPTEEEWEYAARGTDERPYPWGKVWATNRTVSGDSSIKGEPVPVNSPSLANDISPFRVFGMAGNVSEWTNSSYTVYPDSKAVMEDKYRGQKVIRGGHYSARKEATMATYRTSNPVDFIDPHIGFRVAADSTDEDKKRFAKEDLSNAP